MLYPVEITQNLIDKSCLLIVPDLPGCQVKSQSVDEGMILLKKELSDHLAILAEYGENIPHAKSLESKISNNGNHINPNEITIWAMIEFDIIPYLGKSQKINVTLPELLIKKIDNFVGMSSEHKTRSGFIASVCLNELNK